MKRSNLAQAIAINERLTEIEDILDRLARSFDYQKDQIMLCDGANSWTLDINIAEIIPIIELKERYINRLLNEQERLETELAEL